MESNQGYVIRQSVLFDNGRGFAMGENFKAPNPFVTWQFTQEDGKRDYYWGHYFNEECEAIGDYNRRVFSYEKQYGVSRMETSGPDFFKYYSTQRPVDIATYPRPRTTCLWLISTTTPARPWRASHSGHGVSFGISTR